MGNECYVKALKNTSLIFKELNLCHDIMKYGTKNTLTVLNY